MHVPRRPKVTPIVLALVWMAPFHAVLAQAETVTDPPAERTATSADDAQPSTSVGPDDAASEEEIPADLIAMELEQLLDVRVESANKRVQSLRDVDGTVVVVTREDLRRYGYVTLREAFANMPHFFQIDDGEDVELGLRGTLGAGIQFLVNGVPLPPTRVPGLTLREPGRLNIPIESIDRIEIVRGPMSLMYGNNAFMGSVNIITDDAESANWMVSAGAGTGRGGRAFARAATSFEHGSIVLNGGFYSTDGDARDLRETMSAAQLAALPPGSRTDMHGALFRRQLSFDATASFDGLTVNARLSSLRHGMYALVPPVGDDTVLRRDDVHLAATYRRRLGRAVSLRALGVYSQHSYAVDAEIVVPGVTNAQQQSARRAEVEIDMLVSHADRLELTLGYRFLTTFDIRNEIDFPVVGYFGRRTSTPRYLNEVFAQASLRLVDGLHLTGGARVTHRMEAVQTAYDGADRATATSRTDDAPGHASVVPTVAALWNPDDRHSLKLVYAQAVQNPERESIGSTVLERNGTLSLDFRIVRSAFDLQVVAYRSDTRNLARTVMTYDPSSMMFLTRTDNSGRLLTYGTELDVRVRPVGALLLEGSMTVMSTRDIESRIAPGFSPRMLGQTRVAYTWRGLTAAVFAHYVGRMHADWQWSTTSGVRERLGRPADAYASLGANVRYDHTITGIYLNLHASNLLGMDIRYPANELIDWDGGAFGPPRTVFATVGIER